MITEKTPTVDDSTPTSIAEPTDNTGSDDVAGKGNGRVRRLLAGVRAKIIRVLMALFTVGSVALLVALFFMQYRPDQQTDDAAAQSAVAAASQGSVAVLSYSSDTLDQDFASAKTYLTGDFLSYYTQFTDEIVRPAAKQKTVKTTATVPQAAISELRPNTASVLVYINQSTTTADKPEPMLTASSVVVTMSKVDGKWLISAFNPNAA